MDQRRLVLSAVFLLALVGVAAWLTMPRQEDPTMQRRFGYITVVFPGADAETVERLVLEPLEEQLGEVAEIKTMEGTARADFAMINLEMRDDVRDFDRTWDDIEKAAEDARREFPDEVLAPEINRDARDADSVVLAVTGSSDPLVLAAAAEDLKRRLLGMPEISRINLVSDPGEQITIEYDDAVAHRLGIDARLLAAQLGMRNVSTPGGSVQLGRRSATLRPAAEFRSVAEIERTPILLPSGSSVPLGEVAVVRRGPEEPTPARMRLDGAPAVGLGIVPRQRIDLVRFGETLRAELDEARSEFAPLEIREVTFQPDRVETRIGDLGWSLLQGVAIVAAVLFLSMGPRLGLVVASVVPLVALASLAIYAAGGGVLHQMSISALVIALGILVDNAIVVAENIQHRLDEGATRAQAAREAVRELAVPLGVATGTTLAAFVPMLLSQGGTGEFTRAIPVVIMLTLTVSYVFAVLVTPALGMMVLRPSRRPASEGEVAGLARILGRVSVRRPGVVLIGAAVLVGASIAAAGGLGSQFFPTSDRNQVVVDLALPEGTHIDEIDEATAAVERAVDGRADVIKVSSFIGSSAPHFYYNVPAKPSSPHLAQMIVTTRSVDDNDAVIDHLRKFAHAELPAVEVVARKLEQGPPVAAPVEVRLTGHDLAALREGADVVLASLREVPGAVDVRDDMSPGAPTVRFEIDDAAAARRGLSRADVSLALLGQTRGLPVGKFRAGEDPVPIVVRSSAGEHRPVDELSSVTVAAPGGLQVPVGQVARPSVEVRPAAIHHHNRARSVSVFAQTRSGVPASQIVGELKKRLADLELGPGVELAWGGEAEGSTDANSALLSTLPLGMLMLLFFLMVEFNSFRRVAIILTTVPLAITGVVPGLLVSGQPFGFMALLGSIALIGIVVNNAIVLVDVIDRRRREGASLEHAIGHAVELRTRPILLTTVTTVAGLWPLATSSTSLWPPLASAMIAGLLASTALTLLVVPALYRLLLRDRGRQG